MRFMNPLGIRDVHFSSPFGKNAKPDRFRLCCRSIKIARNERHWGVIRTERQSVRKIFQNFSTKPSPEVFVSTFLRASVGFISHTRPGNLKKSVFPPGSISPCSGIGSKIRRKKHFFQISYLAQNHNCGSWVKETGDPFPTQPGRIIAKNAKRGKRKNEKKRKIRPLKLYVIVTSGKILFFYLSGKNCKR